MPGTSSGIVRDAVFSRLRDAIISGYFRPGQRLTEQELAERLSVSRTPVREALRKLELQKLVVTTPYKGVVVRELTLAEAEQIYQVRAVLEGLAARLAAEKAGEADLARLRQCLDMSADAVRNGDLKGMIERNNEFHALIGRATGNSILVEMLDNLQAYINLMRVTSWSDPGRPARTLAEHEAIFEAVAAGRKMEAEQRTVAHVENAWQSARKYMIWHGPPADLPPLRSEGRQ